MRLIRAFSILAIASMCICQLLLQTRINQWTLQFLVSPDKVERRSHFGIENEETNEHIQKRALPPIHWNSSWMGNQWIPPEGYHLFSPRQLQHIFTNHSILFVGDSTARRMYATMFAVLNSTTHPQNVDVHELDAYDVININKLNTTEFCDKKDIDLCRRIPSINIDTDLYQQARCMWNLAADPPYMQNLSNYTMVVFVLGPWEYMQLFHCGGDRRRSETEEFFEKLVAASSLHTKTRFFWRTWGGPGSLNIKPQLSVDQWKNAQAQNHFFKSLVHAYQKKKFLENKNWTQISYIDWGQVMGPRLHPHTKRILGDMDAHFGLEARLTFLQMLANVLVEQERQDALNLGPWWSLSNGTLENINDDCRLAGGQMPYCLSREDLNKSYTNFLTSKSQPSVSDNLTITEMQVLKTNELLFCGECEWIRGQSCNDFLKVMMRGRRLPYHKAIANAMQVSLSCRRNVTLSN